MGIRVAAVVSVLVMASCSRPTPVTYLALDSTSDWGCGPSASDLKLSADDGWKISFYRSGDNMLNFVVEKPAPPQSERMGERWQVGVRAPGGKPLENKRYDCDAFESEQHGSLFFGHGTLGGYSGGWFIVHESDIELDESAMRHQSWKVNRFSADIVLGGNPGSTMYARLRYNATIDPQPSPADVRLALYGKTVVERMEAGFEPFRHQALQHERVVFEEIHGRPPQSQEEFLKQLHFIRLPKLPAGKEFWYDVPNRQLYIRPIGKEPPPAK
jgi:hypothetical protein